MPRNRLSDLTDYNYDPLGNAVPAELPVSKSDRIMIYRDQPEEISAPVVESSPLSNNVDKILNSIFRTDEKRVQLWPEKLIRSGTTAAGKVMSGEIPQWSIDKDTGDVHTSPQMIEAAQEMSALAGTGGLAGGGGSLNATPSLRPALKYKEKLYKGKPGQEHMDVIPKELYPEFQKMAMSGEDISHYNFGFVNDKGHFLNREDALKYAVDNGLVDKHAGRYGALTSTMELGTENLPGSSYWKAQDLPKTSFEKLTPAELNTLKAKFITDNPSDTLTDAALKGYFDRAKQGLTTQLLSDSSKPGVAIEAMKTAQPFFSALEHNVSQIGQSKMTGDQWLGTLSNKPGVKPEELQWTGLGDFLAENKGKPVTKAQIEEHLAANKVELKEVEKGNGNLKAVAEDLQKSVGNGVMVKRGNGLAPLKLYSDEIEMGLYDGSLKPSDLPKSLQSKAQALLDAKATQNDPTKYHSYQLPGGENYREKLLTLPKSGRDAFQAKQNDLMAKREKIQDEFDALYGKDDAATVARRKELTNEFNTTVEDLRKLDLGAAERNNFGDFRSSHWDEPNILAHVRMNDRTIDGKKALHLEEIQSDWHQQGRDKGYRPEQEKKLADLVTQRENLQKEASALSPSDARYKEIYKELPTIQTKINEIGSGNVGVPDAPFKKSWHELALKRMIREAAEKGYDRLSWTPGEAQAARYDLSKQVDKIAVPMVNKDGTRSVRIDAKEGTPFKLMVDKDGKVTGAGASSDQFTGKPLSDVVGKEMAEKIMKLDKSHEFSGEGLKIGGEGMKGFYDQIIPKSLEKLGKEHGIKVKQDKLPHERMSVQPGYKEKSWDVVSQDGTGIKKFDTKSEAEAYVKERGQPVYYIDIPQSLKDTATQKGFPLFAKGGYMFQPVDHNPFENEK